MPRASETRNRPASLCVTGRRDTWPESAARSGDCLLYTSDAADERSSVDLGGRRIIKKQTHHSLEAH